MILFYKSKKWLLILFSIIPIFSLEGKNKKNKHLIDDFYVNNTKMRIYKYRRTHLFKEVYINTEDKALTQLLEHPLQVSVNYLAVPWTRLIKLNKLNSFPHIKIDGGFTICQHLRYKEIIPIIKKIGIDTLFTPHAKKNEYYDGIQIVAFPHDAVHGVEPAKNKDILYSFIGALTHPTREKIFKMKKLDNCIIKRRNGWHFYNASKDAQKKQKIEYQDVLARSRYSLCPVGAGPSTVRFWESLQAGAIPILISDTTVLPEGVEWKNCIIQIAESDISIINDTILNISAEQEKIMRENCFMAYKQFSGENFISAIKNKYER